MKVCEELLKSILHDFQVFFKCLIKHHRLLMLQQDPGKD